jgi:hypothetical protein
MKKVDVNFKRIINESSKFQKNADAKVQQKFNNSKKKFLSDFDNHPITKEIEDGPNAKNSSSTLNGIGNLFSFIGFYSEKNPIQELRSTLSTNFSISKKISSNSTKFIIDYPTLNKIKKVTPMPWENGNSWVVNIEKGISGFSNYMYKKFISGRSKEGLQSEKKQRSGNFKKTKYLTEIIDNFIKEITS